jgi:glycosyltransferase involved in cell wall biosynthesis
MKILWVIAPMLPQIAKLTGNAQQFAGGWLVSVCDGLLSDEGNELFICFIANGRKQSGKRDRLSYESFDQDTLRYSYQTQQQFEEILQREQPDVIHVWGTEYPFTLAMANACEQTGMLDRMVVSIQGLCSVIAWHFAAGLPQKVVRGTTFRDLLRRDNIYRQREKYVVRGAFETAALQKAEQVIGRTDWDRTSVRQINPDAIYHFCNETLRDTFYEGKWSADGCKRHTIFVSQGNYPVKGLHKALAALVFLKKDFPDVRLVTTGEDPRDGSLKKRLRRSTYARYLAKIIRDWGLDDHVAFVGMLPAEQMKQQYLDAHVALTPSSIENSSNSIGEAMLLGVPVVASYVGGTPDLLDHGVEGFLYPFDAPYMMAEYIRRIFSDDVLAAKLSENGRLRAQERHDAARNLSDLNEIYARLASGAEKKG